MRVRSRLTSPFLDVICVCINNSGLLFRSRFAGIFKKHGRSIQNFRLYWKMLFQASLSVPLHTYWNGIINNCKTSLYRSDVLWNYWANALNYWLYNFFITLHQQHPALPIAVCKTLWNYCCLAHDKHTCF